MRQKILTIVNQGFDNKILSKEEASDINHADKIIPGRFMQHLKFKTI